MLSGHRCGGVEKLLYGDTIYVETSVKEVRNAYFVLSHIVLKNNKATAKGRTTMVCIDAKGKPKRIPQDLRVNLLEHLAD